MKVHRSNIRPRLEWFNASDEQGKVGVSLLAHRNEIILDVTLDGERHEVWLTLREVAEALLKRKGR